MGTIPSPTAHRPEAHGKPGRPGVSVPVGTNGNGAPGFRQRVYDLLVGPVTRLCYDAAFDYFDPGAAVLDVGIGNGYMVTCHHDRIKAKALRITGIDVSPAALDLCARRVGSYGLDDQIRLHCAAIEDFQPASPPRFDFVFFSMTFMLMKDQGRVLDRVLPMLRPGGEVAFFQTMHAPKAPILAVVKPRLKWVTGIEFGPVSHDAAFFGLLGERGMTVRTDRLVHKSWHGGEYRFIAAAPATTPPTER